MAGLLLLLLASLGNSTPRCDLVEINHCQSSDNPGFTQVIAWDWDHHYSRWHAQQWAMVSDWSRSGDVTRVSHVSGESICVSSRLFRETWTDRDPERVNTRLFDSKHRRRVW